MFSKNFYEIDEVIASLVTTIFRQAPIETLFWAKELIDSRAASHLIEALVLAYTLKFGPARLEYINVLGGIVLQTKWSEHDLMRATYLLTLIDSSLKSHAVLDYLVVTQADASTPAESSVQWLGRKSPAFDRAMHYLMEVAEPTEASLEPLELPTLPPVLRCIFSEKGRKRRFFPINFRDLYGSCERGFMKRGETTEPVLMMAHKTYYQSISWPAALSPEKAYSDKDAEVDAWEKQMVEIFPDDIPDEWSKEERAKSHGEGCLNENEEVNVQMWLKTHLGGEHGQFHNIITFPNKMLNALYICKLK